MEEGGQQPGHWGLLRKRKRKQRRGGRPRPGPWRAVGLAGKANVQEPVDAVKSRMAWGLQVTSNNKSGNISNSKHKTSPWRLLCSEILHAHIGSGGQKASNLIAEALDGRAGGCPEPR
eukprot:9474953-Pyramimonas_sp.AAC.1